MANATASSTSTPPRRRDLPDRLLLALVAGALAVVAVYLAAKPMLPPAFHAPGSPLLQSAAIGGSLLLLVAFAFVFVKRTGRGGSPVRWFAAHVVCATVGGVLVTIHSTGTVDRLPALMLGALAALVALGVWARVRGSRQMAATFGTKQAGFRAPDEAARARLAALVTEKRGLLARLDPAASEATFSVTLAHRLRRPLLARAYERLAAEESELIGTRRSVAASQAYWRALHILIAWGFVLGLLAHVVIVTFFAGYVAEGRDIYWWHLADWDF